MLDPAVEVKRPAGESTHLKIDLEEQIPTRQELDVGGAEKIGCLLPGLNDPTTACFDSFVVP